MKSCLLNNALSTVFPTSVAIDDRCRVFVFLRLCHTVFIQATVWSLTFNCVSRSTRRGSTKISHAKWHTAFFIRLKTFLFQTASMSLGLFTWLLTPPTRHQLRWPYLCLNETFSSVKDSNYRYHLSMKNQFSHIKQSVYKTSLVVILFTAQDQNVSTVFTLPLVYSYIWVSTM